MISKEYNLRPLWDALYEIYAKVAEICDRHALRYYAFAGTLLGAIRHNGFIPWDDDLDIAMPRPDYEKFIEIAKTELPEYLKFVNWRNTPEFNYMFGKVQDCRKDKVLEIEDRLGYMLSNGVYIDIFPIDGYPRSRFYRAYLKIRDLLLIPVERFHMWEFSRLTSKGKLAWLVGAVLSVFVPWLRTQRQFFTIHEKAIMKARYEDCALVSDVGLRYNVLSQPVLAKDRWGEPALHDFDGKTIAIPAGYREYLEKKFGDYMKPPPVELQKPRHQYSWRCPWWLGPTN